MKSYYVYYVKNAPHQTLAFVDNLTEFWKKLSEEELNKLSFTGIMVKASDPRAAYEIYSNPTKGDFFFVEEPQNPLKILEKSIEAFRIVILESLINLLTIQSKSINSTISRIAEQIHEQSDKKIKVDDIYNKMKELMTQKISKWQYDERH